MQLQQMLNQISNKNAPENVKGWERAASAVTGLMLVKKGLRGRGLTSLMLLATGGMAIMRAVNGRCELKRKLEESQHSGSQGSDKERYSHMPMDSEVHSTDFKSSSTSMPDSTKMGNEASAARGATTSSSSGGSTTPGATSTSSTPGSAGSSTTPGSSSTSSSAAGVGSSSTLGNTTPPTGTGSSGSAGTSGTSGSSSTSGKSGSSGKQ
ncbi:Protein of unknown function [Halopseudomonas xinjiangensis]|uniref:DUF2892 family protein n=1 Tax=Halopseudomonas xinjiangensis TaxID=487184 RepID=A0A1H1T8N8_9GAMM|nr:YgaP-like transmembrane domain [Halopseudomonas xinjiangensis]SDS56640.1 Protein of unknown function [Halopseudomonas xinjiangensis]